MRDDHKESQRFHALDSFRGICALAVVIFHMHVLGAFSEQPFFRSADLFVDYFFVLSGFVFSYSYGQQQGLEIKRFLVSRTFRLFPLHLLMLVVFVVFEIAKLQAAKKGFVFNNEPFTGEYAYSQMLPNALLVQSWTTLTENYSFNYPSWSISIEYYMYLLFALIVLLAFRARYLLWAVVSVVAFMDLLMGSAFFTLPAAKGLSCFFAGALAYLLYRKLSKAWVPGYRLMSVVELVSVALVVALLSSNLEARSLMCTLLFCVTVVVFAFDKGLLSQCLGNRLFGFLGKLSYSIYMTHAAVLFCFVSLFIVAQKFLGRPLAPTISGTRFLDSGSVSVNNMIVCAVIVCVVLVSALTYKYVELPGQKFGRRLLGASRVSGKRPVSS